MGAPSNPPDQHEWIRGLLVLLVHKKKNITKTGFWRQQNLRGRDESRRPRTQGYDPSSSASGRLTYFADRWKPTIQWMPESAHPSGDSDWSWYPVMKIHNFCMTYVISGCEDHALSIAMLVYQRSISLKVIQHLSYGLFQLYRGWWPLKFHFLKAWINHSYGLIKWIFSLASPSAGRDRVLKLCLTFGCPCFFPTSSKYWGAEFHHVEIFTHEIS